MSTSVDIIGNILLLFVEAVSGMSTSVDPDSNEVDAVWLRL